VNEKELGLERALYRNSSDFYTCDLPKRWNAGCRIGAASDPTKGRHWCPVGRCGVVGSTLAFGSIGHAGSNPSTAYFHIMVHQPSAS